MNKIRQSNEEKLLSSVSMGNTAYIFKDPWGELWIDILGDWNVKFPEDKLCFIIKPKKK